MSTAATMDDSKAYNPTVRDYITLLKPRVMSLVVFAGIAGMVAAPGHIHPLLAAVAVMCIALSAGGAAAINMWYDRDIDAIMARTKGRPLPQGRMAPESALEFGIVLSAGASLQMGRACGHDAAVLQTSARTGAGTEAFREWLLGVGQGAPAAA